MSRRRHVRPSSSAVPRHRRSFDPTRLIKPGTIGAVVIAFAALLGLGGTAALWQDSATINPGSLNSGSIGITQSGFETAAVEYSSSVSERTASLVLSNPGSSSANLSASVALSGSTTLANRVVVRIWPAVNGACGAPTGDAGSWASLQGIPSTLAAKSSITLCLRTTLSDVATDAGAAYSAKLTVVASRGSWRSSAEATVAQSVAKAVAAVGAVSCAQGRNADITIGWPQAAGIKDGQAYLVSVNSVNIPVSASSYTRSNVYVAGMSSLASVPRATSYMLEVRVEGSSTVVASRSVYWGADEHLHCEPMNKFTCKASNGTVTITGTGEYSWAWRAYSSAGLAKTVYGSANFSLTASNFSAQAPGSTFWVDLTGDGNGYFSGQLKLDASRVLSCA